MRVIALEAAARNSRVLLLDVDAAEAMRAIHGYSQL
jgi:hypothetical protein